MTASRFLSAALGATLLTTPVAHAGGDDIVGGIIGGVIGGVIVNEAAKSRAKKSTTTRTTSVSSATRAQNREVQTSLNYFGFPAGTPDGVLGRNSRSAISQYQAYLGYPVTGQLTIYERDFLVQSYQRAIAGGAATNQVIASNPDGARGLLVSYRDQLAGLTPAAPPPAAQTTVVVAPQAPATTTVTSTGQTTTLAATPALPNFMAEQNETSLASHCNTVSLVTNTNGGFTTLASLSDPEIALNEQFCLARTYAIASGEALAAKVQGFSADQIEAQCKSLAPALQPQIAALSIKPQVNVVSDTSDFVLNSGINPAQLAGTAKICLSVGYRTDDMQVALASALVLVALGEKPYAELLGHHLLLGFGASQRTDFARAWYVSAGEAIRAGQPAVFAPGQPERTALILAAAERLDAGGSAVQAPQPAAAPGVIPLFQIDQ